MVLNNEKLQLSTLRFILRRKRAQRKKMIADSARFKKIMTMAGERLDKWVADGKYKLRYDSMDDILRDLDLTSDELVYYCSTTYKKKFLTWRKELRMEDAKRLLLEFPEIPASKIGISLGITDKSDFRHQFKGYTGFTPLEWRKKFLRKNLR